MDPPGKLALLFLLLANTAAAQSWTLTTVAGSTDGGGYVDAQLFHARFSSPHSVAVDSAGNVYVADRGNHVIRKVSRSLDVTTVAGMAGVSGSAHRTGRAARLYFPARIALDPLHRHLS